MMAESWSGPSLSAYGLKVNGRIQPLELDAFGETRFTWRLRGATSDGPSLLRVVVAREEKGADQTVWESPWFDNLPTAWAAEGLKLAPLSSYRWTVQVQGGSGGITESTGRFATAPEALEAEWILRDPAPWFDSEGRPRDTRAPVDLNRSWRTMYSQPALQLRTQFIVPGKVMKARVFMTAKGVYRGFLNGGRIGSDELTPGWTSYEDRLDFQGYEVTDLVKEGSNTWAAQVADGWWSGYVGYHTRKQAEQYGSATAFFGELHIELGDGTQMVVRTGPTWEERFGSIVMSDLLMGEYQDYTVETAGWLTCQDEGPWRPVVVQENTLKLSPQIAEPMQVVKSLKPQSVEVLDSSIIVDFGQNLVGRIRLTLADSERGASIKIFHGEMLDNGDLYTVNLRSAEAMDAVVAPGGPFVFEPLFTLHGFRYVKIEGLGKQAGRASVEALVVSSALEETGRVATSSSLVNRLLANIEWSQRGNFVGIPTDCNQRDERLGWTADAQIFAPTASFNSHVEAFFDSWLRDLMSSQRADGCIPDVAPLPPTSYNFSQGAPAWADAATIVPWHLYKTYGDLAKLRSFFPMMKAWVDYVASVNPTDSWINALGNNYGDWLSVNANTPKTVVSLAYRIHSVDIVALAAEALGMSDLAERYRLSAKELREGFVTRFISDEGAVHGETQTGYLFALAWDIAPSHLTYKLVSRLVKNIRDNGNLLSTGFLGVNLLCPTLTRFGHQDLAVDLLMEERFPSWGYSISQGATTIWERWDGWTEANGFHTPTMNSFNHYSLGSVGEWVYRQLAGIDQTRDSVAYKDIFVEPIFTPRLDYVEAEFESPRGRIKSAWYREGSTYRLEVEVPPGSQATVRLGGKDHIVESGAHQFLGIEK